MGPPFSRTFQSNRCNSIDVFLIFPDWIYNIVTQDKASWQANIVATFKDHTDNIKNITWEDPYWLFAGYYA